MMPHMMDVDKGMVGGKMKYGGRKGKRKGRRAGRKRSRR